jgi:alanine dehydrogenase
MSLTKHDRTLLLTRTDVSELLGIDECIEAVEHAFTKQRSAKTTIAGVHAPSGGFHLKAALLDLDGSYFAAKINANFPSNHFRHGLPTIQGAIALFNAENGYPLALMDSIQITTLRTGAASAVAAKYLARRDARVLTLCGCGTQGHIQLRAISRVRRPEMVYAFDLETARAEQIADELKGELSVDVLPVDDLEIAVRKSDICVTCTPSRRTIVLRDWVKAGTFIAAVGADSEDKQEIDPRLMAASKVVVDSLPQCAAIGDLHHAIAQGLMTAVDVHAELTDVITGQIAGRVNDDEIIVFDSTGSALLDVAATAAVYRRALQTGRGTFVNLGR